MDALQTGEQYKQMCPHPVPRSTREVVGKALDRQNKLLIDNLFSVNNCGGKIETTQKQATKKAVQT